MSAFRERAFLVCQAPDKKLSHGPVVTGSRGNVKMPTVCPARTKPIGVVHDHPPEDVLLPSDDDLAVTFKHGLDFVCVIHQENLRCFPVR